MDYIDQNYVDTINTSSLLDAAISDMLGKLDPHSAYIPKENLQDIQERMQGKFVGIGIQFRIINDSITVIEPIKIIFNDFENEYQLAFANGGNQNNDTILERQICEKFGIELTIEPKILKI